MLKPWLKRILQIAGTLALVTLVVTVYQRTDWSKCFSPDGDLTLVAAVIAFIAVIFQIRSSSKQVQDQMKAQREAEKAELERRRRAVAAALLSEIDCFYASHLRRTREISESWKTMESRPQSVEIFYAPVGKPFAVYESLADNAGGFEATIARGVVLTYGLMARFIDVLNRYEQETSRASSRDPTAEEIRRQARDAMRNTIRQVAEQAMQIAVPMCRKLCDVSGTDFSTLFIARDSNACSQDMTGKSA